METLRKVTLQDVWECLLEMDAERIRSDDRYIKGRDKTWEKVRQMDVFRTSGGTPGCSGPPVDAESD